MDELFGMIDTLDAQNKVTLYDTNEIEKSSGGWISDILSNISESIEKHKIETIIEILEGLET